MEPVRSPTSSVTVKVPGLAGAVTSMLTTQGSLAALSTPLVVVVVTLKLCVASLSAPVVQDHAPVVPLLLVSPILVSPS